MKSRGLTNRRNLIKLSAIAAGSVGLAACSQTAAPSPTAAPQAAAATGSTPAAAKPTTSASATSAPTTAAAAPTASAASTGLKSVPRNRTLIMAGLGGEDPGAFTDVHTFNPFSPGYSRSGYYQAATEGLFYYNMLAGEFIHWIGESYSYNSDYTELTVKIRPGVEWSDGQPFTSKDIAFTYNLMKGNPGLLNAADIHQKMKSVQAVDNQTVKFTMNSPQPRFHFDYLTFRADIGITIVPEHVWNGQDPQKFNNYDPSKGWPLGTGPYKLVGTTIQQKIWDVRPDWWAVKTGFKKLPQVERLIFLPGMNEITMAQMLITNQTDMAFSLTAANLQLVQGQNPKIITSLNKPPYGYMDWWPIGLGFNDTVAPFNDPEIRWAISYALDRNEIVQFAFDGHNEPAVLPYPAYPPLEAYENSIKDLLAKYPTNKFDLNQTNAIMTKKGYKKGSDGMWADSSGKKLSFQIVTFPQHPSTTPQAPIVTQMLRKAGFDASFLLPADFVTRIETGAAHAYLWGHGGSMVDPYKTLNLYNIRYVVPTGTLATANLYRWSNKEFSDIVDQMGRLPDSAPPITGLFRKAMEIWLPNLPDVQLTQTVINVPMNETYWKNWPIGTKPYIHPGFWHRTGLLIFANLQAAQ